MPRVHFEPLGESVECGMEETVLDAAFREGWSLVHGCREGQCSACKCFLLEGEVVLKPYSSFALSESEEEAGYTLLCRAMPEEDLVVELLHFDPDDVRLAFPIVEGRASVVETSELSHDVSRVVLFVEEPAGFDFRPGHYLDLEAPGADRRRSFSIANLPGDGTVELIVKRYPGGHFSGLLESGRLPPGTVLSFGGPYGAMHLRDGDDPILLIAGGSGMAPVLGLLRELVRTGATRPVRGFYGGRGRADLICAEEVAALGAQLADFAWTPVLSEEPWDGETGFVHEAVDRFLQSTPLDDPEVFVCGPPPMVDAVLGLLVDGHDLDAGRVHFDKFTTAVAVADQGA